MTQRLRDSRTLPYVAVCCRMLPWRLEYRRMKKNCVGGPQLQRVRTLMYVSTFFVSSPLSLNDLLTIWGCKPAATQGSPDR